MKDLKNSEQKNGKSADEMTLVSKNNLLEFQEKYEKCMTFVKWVDSTLENWDIKQNSPIHDKARELLEELEGD